MTCPLTKTDGCEWCGKKLVGRQKRWCSRRCSRSFTANHRWTQAKAMAKARVVAWKCEACGEYTEKPEVNHKIPVKGQHGKWGCHHHQENLEVLCRPCHLAATADQRAKGLI